jgi:hypothetical protein
MAVVNTAKEAIRVEAGAMELDMFAPIVKPSAAEDEGDP